MCIRDRHDARRAAVLIGPGRLLSSCVISPAPYPLTFEPFLLQKVWGGDRLSRFGKPVKPGATIGESWELADLPRTSASGAGGGAFRSVIANGPLRGKTLHDASTLWREALMGDARPTPGDD